VGSGEVCAGRLSSRMPRPGAVIVITNADDPRIHEYTNLKDVNLRKLMEPAQGLFIAESARVIEQALSLGYVARSLLLAEPRAQDFADVIALAGPAPVYVAPYDVLKDVTGFHVHRGALAALQRPEQPSVSNILDGARRIVILESIVDHTNVGAIFRTVAALGWDGILITPDCADPLYRRSVRVSMGATLHLPWNRLSSWPQDLDRVRAAGFNIIGLTPDSAAVPMDVFARGVPDRVAMVLGTEGEGLTTKLAREVDHLVRIPMAEGRDSLNVGAAAAIACWEMR
jgi:tRNA G18 (ribose-2'-O)-methylase SpoU